MAIHSHRDTTTGRLWVEPGDQRQGIVAEVAPLIPVRRTYSFAVPEAVSSELAVGQRVRVPLGRKGRLVEGFVVALDRRPWDSTLRPLDSTVEVASYIPTDLVELGRSIAEHYACPLGQTLNAITPHAVRRGAGFKIVRYAALARSLDEILEQGKRVGAKQRAVLNVLGAHGGPLSVEKALMKAEASSATVKSLVARGWIDVQEVEEVSEAGRLNLGGTAPVEPAFNLTDEQREALDHILPKITEERFSVTLLYGVSGSGKTEIYVRAIRHVLEQGKQAILLVPEIVLTTQLVQRLTARFPSVAVSHSGLTDAQRSVMWRQAASGKKPVVIGTRSAVFAPCPNLGLIVVDEEQETGYKNLQAPRFHVRDVAIMRGQQLGIPVVLGSATPSIEVWYRSTHHPDYQRVMLRRRVMNLPMPSVHIVDMEQEQAERKDAAVLSRMMERLLDETLQRGEQALILMNRRGFARRLHCPACRTRVECPNCNAGYVVHSSSGQSMCHYCRARIPTPTICPNLTCGAPLVQIGIGTQRVERLLSERFPSAHVQRVDSDTMTRRGMYQQIVDDFEAKRIDVLVGTQMIAKGLDFPLVSFVGVVNADPTALGSDFRAHERLFQLIAQVAGRAGRADRPGRVVVQTTMPELPALAHALRHDYEAFAEEELEARRRVGLPPFRRTARIVLADARDDRAWREAAALAERIREHVVAEGLPRAEVLGPNPCPLHRIRRKYRHDLLVLTESAGGLRRLLRSLDEGGALRVKAENMVIDVDPVEMM